MSTVCNPPQRHRCSPPRHRPRAEWNTVSPPLGWMKPEARATAKPVAVPTQYPPGTVWRCTCGRLWHAMPTPPPRYGYSGAGVMWRPVRWYHRKLRRQVAVCDTRAAHEAATRVVESWEGP